MSGAEVWRVGFPASSVVVKIGARPGEVAFYRRVADGLRRQGVPIPALEHAGRSAGTAWLVIEDIPTPLPTSRYLADVEVLTALRRLHVATWDQPPPYRGMFRPRWTEAASDAAMARFPPSVAAEIGPLLRALRRGSAHLFRPRCAISGDPNPANWGLRAGGGVVLYDWERYGRGTPALDLAITVPGLGDAGAFRLVATRYADIASASIDPGPDPGPVETLERDIGLAKVWTVVEFLATLGPTTDDRAATVADWLASSVPDWIRLVHQALA
jgi:hypothetical protein